MVGDCQMRGWLKGSTMLLCLMGLTWPAGYGTVIQPLALPFAYAFVLLNAFQVPHLLLSSFVCAL